MTSSQLKFDHLCDWKNLSERAMFSLFSSSPGAHYRENKTHTHTHMSSSGRARCARRARARYFRKFKNKCPKHASLQVEQGWMKCDRTVRKVNGPTLARKNDNADYICPPHTRTHYYRNSTLFWRKPKINETKSTSVMVNYDYYVQLW